MWGLTLKDTLCTPLVVFLTAAGRKILRAGQLTWIHPPVSGRAELLTSPALFNFFQLQYDTENKFQCIFKPLYIGSLCEFAC